MIVVLKYLVPKGYNAIVLFPFIFVRSSKERSDKILVNHERIHLQQQLELLIIPFFLWYGIEFVVRYIKHGYWKLAYKSISFEKEAYHHERDLGYLQTRSLWKFWSYL